MNIRIINELTAKHVGQLHELYQNEWWTKGRSLEETTRCVNGSQLCIGLIDDAGNLQGFARVITDFTFKALIFDVIVSSNIRGLGMSNVLLDNIKNHAALSSVKHFELYCLPELHDFYTKHGFSTDVGGIQLMRLVNA
ncbi:GNAT family N-acetyltransferase [Thalassolituus oleivorans]|uniref:GNAT family N-acetyltransferase n=1 Tax=Thalassolituus oleivorans TaxID=187493 RepID=UPI0009494B6C|nr:GNAT family N-acetyltransferase [Thalassolituus oleivorans]APR66772.1 GNAT family N-acetyltransferase [Thalassolituus oleivorans]